MPSGQFWKTELYDNKLGFVSEYGKEVVELLSPAPGEKILDVGCGTGDLAYDISKTGATVIGMDFSAEMIEKARVKYPTIHFFTGNAEQFQLDETFDAVFSNAALHWMKNAKQVVENVWNVLNSGGRFVAEFGGKGNVNRIVKATTDVLDEDYAIDAEKLNPWFFPCISEYSHLLEQQGFRVTYAVLFDRPTKMEDGEEGLSHWLSGFANQFFANVSEEDKKLLYAKIAARVRNDLFHDDTWYVDYVRIRVKAIKP
ncbi:SAM-dependent methyltransferase [Paenibacillus sp. FSL A5-0031]|uniref:class I SAM-dependent methyltransferase n=1 Tax=Paenibacillus sp. FSL A5-0031 TaxID=1920420 RepID=UPI00096ED9BE|nr:class I SAM-dependent methyltransferase [Paenibacillus sp. FSL A5-0031]OME88070.1 SAM-dependent methyltransferase [Paenibacillus sp. FSL A5-0031]